MIKQVVFLSISFLQNDPPENIIKEIFITTYQESYPTSLSEADRERDYGHFRFMDQDKDDAVRSPSVQPPNNSKKDVQILSIVKDDNKISILYELDPGNIEINYFMSRVKKVLDEQKNDNLDYEIDNKIKIDLNAVSNKLEDMASIFGRQVSELEREFYKLGKRN